MPTDVPAFRIQLLAERAAVVAELALVDVADEQARQDANEAEFAVAMATHKRKSKRWNIIEEKRNRLDFLDDQIATVTP